MKYTSGYIYIYMSGVKNSVQEQDDTSSVVTINSLDALFSTDIVAWIRECVDEINGLFISHPIGIVHKIDFLATDPNEDSSPPPTITPTPTHEIGFSQVTKWNGNWPSESIIVLYRQRKNFNSKVQAMDIIIHEIIHSLFFRERVFQVKDMLLYEGTPFEKSRAWFIGANAKTEFDKLYESHPKFQNYGVPLSFATGAHYAPHDLYYGHCVCIPGFQNHGEYEGPSMHPYASLTHDNKVIPITLGIAKDLGFGVNDEHPLVDTDFRVPDLPDPNWTECSVEDESFDLCLPYIELTDFSRLVSPNFSTEGPSYIVTISFTVRINNIPGGCKKWYYQISDSNYPSADQNFNMSSDTLPDDVVAGTWPVLDNKIPANATEHLFDPDVGYYVLSVFATDESDVVLSVEQKRFAIFNINPICISGLDIEFQGNEMPNLQFATASPIPESKPTGPFWPGGYEGKIDRIGHAGRQLWRASLGIDVWWIWGHKDGDVETLARKWVLEKSEINGEPYGNIESTGVIAVSEETEGEPWEATWPEDIIVTIDECEPTPTQSLTGSFTTTFAGDPHVCTFFGEKYDM
tara:strand:+ start:129240 stop:130964 length:1725 start_codon:yes stop_codon:yes gene_type:complete